MKATKLFLLYFGIWYIMGKMDVVKLSCLTFVLLTNIILLSVINTAVATIFHGVTNLAIVRKKRYFLPLVSTLPTVFLISTFLAWKFFRNYTIFSLFAGSLVLVSHAWLKVTQLYRYIDGANARGALEGHSGRNTFQI